MRIQDIIREAAETLREMPTLSGVPVIELDKGNATNELNLKVAQAKVAVLVSWNGFTPKIQGGTAVCGLNGTATLVVSVFEKPVVNRVNPTAPTLLDMAQEIANILNCAAAEGMDAPIFLKRITPIVELPQEKDSSIVTCDVEFDTETSL